jgi:hypothetical protein
VTGEDLKRLQDNFFEDGKSILCDNGRLRPTGFVVTLQENVDKIFRSEGWELEILDPKTCVLDDQTNKQVTTLIIDLLMDWKRLYQAVLQIFPQTQEVLPHMIKLASTIGIDDPYKRTMRPFLRSAQLDEKDIIAATMRKLCSEVDAFASIFQCEAWMRAFDPADKNTIEEAGRRGLDQDTEAVEVLFSSMETYGFTRMLTLPIHRGVPSAKQGRDGGNVVGFGERLEGLDTPADTNRAGGRLTRFLKPWTTHD